MILHQPYQEDVCQRTFLKHGLRLNVPISSVDIGKKETFPILKPSDFLKTIDQTKSWTVICGKSDLQQAQSMFTTFWQRFAVLFPNHQVFDRSRQNDIRLDRACPVYIHGDEGQYYKRSAIMIVQWQGVLGKGTTKNQVAEHGVNSIGHTLRTRLLCGCMTKEPLLITVGFLMLVSICLKYTNSKKKLMVPSFQGSCFYAHFVVDIC